MIDKMRLDKYMVIFLLNLLLKGLIIILLKKNLMKIMDDFMVLYKLCLYIRLNYR